MKKRIKKAKSKNLIDARQYSTNQQNISNSQVNIGTGNANNKTTIKKVSSRNEQAINPQSETEEKLVLIMKGGGIKGLVYVGVLEIIQEHFKFDWFAGTSAGAISAILLAAGFTTEELKEELSKKDFSAFKDAGFPKKFLNLLSKNGLYEANTFTTWVDTLLAKKLNSSVDVQLGELPKRATVYASQEGKKALVYDSKKIETKNIRAAYAARCSMSIPYIFTPQQSEGIDVFDGGVQNNYPVEVFKKENPKIDFIGLYLGPEIFEGLKKKSILSKLVSIWTEAVEIEALRKYKEQTIIIDPRPISTMQFSLNEEEKEFLLDCGRLSGLKFLARKGIKSQSLINIEALEKKVNEKRATLTSRYNRRRRTKYLVRVVLVLVSIFLFTKILFRY